MPDMTMNEAMYQRHTVRKYIDTPIPPEIVDALEERIKEQNERYGLTIRLVRGDTGAFPAVIRLLFAKGVKNYLIMCGGESRNLDERLGYSGADLMLYAQTLGLNTWWGGGTFHRKKVSQAVSGKKVTGVIAIGYGAVQGVPHRMKRPQEVSAFAGTAPAWFQKGVDAALLAPTALAKQAFFIKGTGRSVSIACDHGIFSGTDKGLVKYHFELGAGRENFTWDMD